MHYFTKKTTNVTFCESDHHLIVTRHWQQLGREAERASTLATVIFNTSLTLILLLFFFDCFVILLLSGKCPEFVCVDGLIVSKDQVTLKDNNRYQLPQLWM